MAPAAAEGRRLAALRVSDAPVERTTWTVAGSPAGLIRATSTLERQTPAAVAAEQVIAAANALVEVAAAAASDLPAAVVAEGFDRWRRVYAAAVARLEAMPRIGSEELSAAGDRLAAARQEAAKAIEKLQPLSTMEPGAAPSGAEDALAGAVCFVGGGQTAELKIEWRVASTGSAAVRTRWAAVGLALWLGLAAVVRWPPARDCLARYCHFVLALGGVAWWLMMPLGWLGWLVVAAAIGLALSRRPWYAVYR
jgi:hypothetical protein